MAKLIEIVNFLDKYLRVGEIEDNAINGLQVDGREDVKKVALAVDACLDVFDRAKDLGADMIIVHHGLFWKDTDPRIVGFARKRIEALLTNGISLYAAHLPLDSHPDAGNNAVMGRLIGLSLLKPFGNYHGVSCGYSGQLKKEYDLDDFLRLVEEKIGKIRVRHLFGAKKIRCVGIVSGGGAFAVGEMEKDGIDILISGEQQHVSYNPTRELHVNAIYLGHYDSEVFGVKALGEKLKEKFRDVDTVFVDNQTEL
ncbi:MAG: Nif3-like dinuclear metal center hexameric protein [archaeon]